MSAEYLNNASDPQQIDPERESELLAFAESMNDTAKAKTKTTRQCKWMAALKRRFSRRTLTLIFSSSATILLAIVLVVVMLSVKDNSISDGTTQPSDNVVEQTETPKVTLLDKTVQTGSSKKSYLQQVDIQNADDTYTILYDDASKNYVLKDYEDIALSSKLLLTLRSYTETITALEKVENAGSLDVYGLEKPEATATITYADGDTARLLIGSKTPSAAGYYVQLDGTKDIYIFATNSVALFRHGSVYFADTTLITPPSVKESDKDAQAVLKEITYTGTAHPTPLVMRRSAPSDGEDMTYFSYIITSPYKRCTSDAVSTALSSVQSISAEQALYLHPSAEIKTKLGFDNPLIHIDATLAVEKDDETAADIDEDDARPKIYYNSINYKLTIGSVDENGNYIAMLDGVDAIFLIDKASYEFVLGRTYLNSVNEYLFFKHIKSLDRISVEFDGKKFDFHLTHYPEQEDQADQLDVTIDGKRYSTEEFRELYELMMALERHGTPASAPSGDAALIVSLYEPNNQLYLSAEYYETSASMCTVKTSQGEVLSTLWSDVSFFIQQVKNYIDGKDVLIRN